MIILNSKKFAETETEVIDSLFAQGGTCVGYAKRNKRSIKLYDMQKQLVGVINKYGVLARASLSGDRYRYQATEPDIVGRYKRFSDSVEEPKSYAVAHTWGRYGIEYCYK